jgi:hypothetical protein
MAESQKPRIRETLMLLLYFLLGPLLLFIVAADARGGGSLRQRIHHDPESGMRYLFVFALGVTFVGVMAAFAAG